MPKTTFIYEITKITAVFANLISRHNHLGLDEDGSNSKITQAEVDPTIQALLNSIAVVQPTIAALNYNGYTRTSVFGGNGKDGAFVASALNNSLNKGVYNFTDFTIGSGFTVNATGGLIRIKCTGNVVINGTLSGTPSTHNRIASGFYVSADPAYNLSASLRGSSGSDGRRVTDTTGLETILGQGGKPGTSLIIEALGTITIGATGLVRSIGETGQLGQILSGTHSLPGSGGGTGGAAIIQSFTNIIQTGIVDVSGGKGCDGLGANSEGGSGGSGGFAILQAPAITATDVNLIVAGGAAGISLGDRRHWGSPGGSYAAVGGQRGNAGASGIVEKNSTMPYHIY